MIVVDGNNLAYRVFAAYPSLTTQKGKPVSVIYGVTKLVRAVIQQTHEDLVVVVWDGSPTARRELYPDYKANRKANRTPQEEQAYNEYREQLPEAMLVLQQAGVRQCWGQNTEADDLIAIAPDILDYVNRDGNILVVSEDKDMLQLVSSRVRVFRPIKNEFYDADNFVSKTGLTPEQYLSCRVLEGDDSDNIKGVPGVGEKTSRKLIQQYGSLDAIVNAAQSTDKPAIMVRIREHRNTIVRNKMLMDLRYARNMILDDPVRCMIPGTFDEVMLRKIFIKYEFFSYVNSWSEFTAPFRRLK